MDGAPTKLIDPARPGLGKGIAWATGTFGCERQAFYGETVRDDRGWRIPFPMPEKVHFGTAIDVLHAALSRRLRDDGDWGDLDSAIDLAYHAGMRGTWDAEPDRDVFRVQITNAARLLVGEVEHPEQHGPPILYLPTEGMRIQGLDGASLEVPHIFGDRPLVATPDYLWVDDAGTITAWLDVKSTGRAFSYPDKWLGAEATIYTLACALTNGGEVPHKVGYLEYRRNARPYWHLTWAQRPDTLAKIARAYVTRWTKALHYGDADLVSFSPTRCGTCPWARPMPDVGFTGCEIGMALPNATDQEGNTDG